jgi:poly(3-hydroxybutyrate) depolymerase
VVVHVRRDFELPVSRRTDDDLKHRVFDSGRRDVMMFVPVRRDVGLEVLLVLLVLHGGRDDRGAHVYLV